MQVGDLVKEIGLWTSHNPWMTGTNLDDSRGIIGIIIEIDANWPGHFLIQWFTASALVHRVWMPESRLEVINESR
tara:strand:+ start:528 stop:752 length:225 start_codon:yes stop_codon:yes gene_type:complete